MTMCIKCKKRMAVVFISGQNNVAPGGYCLKCATELGIGNMSSFAKQMGVSEEDFSQMVGQMDEMMALDPLSQKDEEPSEEDFVDNVFDDSKAKEKGKGKPKNKKRKYLTDFCDNLTGKAKDGKLDKVIGRDREIYRVIQILNRRQKNNPCLIGEPGVGKTAIAEAIAQKIVARDVPPRLIGKEVFLLDLTALVAGTHFRGQFESRVKGLVDEVKANGNIILFIDEVHNLVGTGDSEGTMNAANILKPALSRGEIQVIGATTFNEYRKYIEKDSALERRFQSVKVVEPTIEETVKMLLGIKQYYEKHHTVTISDYLITRCVSLSERYINDRFLPDKAIDLLDEACSCASLKNMALWEYEKLNSEINDLKIDIEEKELNTDNIDFALIAELKSDISKKEKRLEELSPNAFNAEVTEEDIARVIELWTGIPALKIEQNDLSKVQNLAEKLKESIIGQDEAVGVISAAIKRSRVSLSKIKRPASFIFVGSTGIGKTQLVKTLAKELFDDTDPLIRLDMSEYMEKHSVSKIIGSPPGYVGYDEAGQLTEKIRRKPYSVVLFDEIEKAHPDVLNILLQILDEGKISDSHGRNVSFENVVIVMTSNAGSNIAGGSAGFNKPTGEINKQKALKALSEFLRPEFLGRVDEVVVFRDLNKEDYSKIACLMLNEFETVLVDRGINFTYTQEAADLIASEAFGNKSGARDIRRVIRRKVEDTITDKIIYEQDKVKDIQLASVNGVLEII